MTTADAARAGGWLSRWYRFWYRLGVTPWEQDTDVLAPQVGRLVASVEAGREPPYGRALDLGCGRGRWSIELARRGWQVVGVDVVPRAVEAAGQQALEAGVDATFVVADATRLREAGLGSGFTLVLDVECLHHLDTARRRAVAGEIDAVTTADATLLTLAWSPGRRGPLPSGVSRDELEALFPAWQVMEDEVYSGPLPRPLRGVAPRWYRLARS